MGVFYGAKKNFVSGDDLLFLASVSGGRREAQRRAPRSGKRFLERAASASEANRQRSGEDHSRRSKLGTARTTGRRLVQWEKSAPDQGRSVGGPIHRPGTL